MAHKKTNEHKSRGGILFEAHEIINGERLNAYGEPEDNFKTIAGLWTAYFDYEVEVTPLDVAMMMTLLKIARIRTGTATADSFVDAAGYIGIAADMEEVSA